MSRTTATAVHAAAVVLALLLAVLLVLPSGPTYAAATSPRGHDHPAPSPAAPAAPGGMPGMSAHDHAAMGQAGHQAATADVAVAGVSDSTRATVLGGFAAANVAALGTALVLRRRGAGRRRPRLAR